MICYMAVLSGSSQELLGKYHQNPGTLKHTQDHPRMDAHGNVSSWKCILGILGYLDIVIIPTFYKGLWIVKSGVCLSILGV